MFKSDKGIETILVDAGWTEAKCCSWCEYGTNNYLGGIKYYCDKLEVETTGDCI